MFGNGLGAVPSDLVVQVEEGLGWQGERKQQSGQDQHGTAPPEDTRHGLTSFVLVVPSLSPQAFPYPVSFFLSFPKDNRMPTAPKEASMEEPP